MNLESSLRNLDGELGATEPPWGTTAADVRRRAGVVRRRRRSLLAVSACVVAVVGIVLGPRLVGAVGSEDTSVAGKDSRVSSAEELAGVIRQIGLDHAPAGVGEDSIIVEALDANGNRIEGADRDKASEWVGEFDYGLDHRLDLRLTHGPLLPLDEEEGSCAAAVDTGWAVSCDVEELSDGSIVRVDTRGVVEANGAWEGVTTDRFEAESERLWMQRTVRHHHPDGDATTVTALARAEAREGPSIDGLATDEELNAIAADTRLRFPAPPQTADGCDWVVNDKRSSHWCLSDSAEEPPEDDGNKAKVPQPPSRDFEVRLDQAASVDADLEALARGFIDYALGQAEDLPVAVTVGFSLGGEVSKHIDDIVAALPNRGIWRFCPADWEIYGASSCPVDVLGQVVSAGANGTALVISDEPGEVTCAPERTGPLPEGRLVVIRPVETERTCASDFQLALEADEDGRLTWVDLTLAAP